MADFGDRTVVITGASRGLGRALACAFADVGFKISACSRSQAAMVDLRADLQSRGVPHVCDVVDVRDEDQVMAWVEHTCSSLGSPAVLINNASLLGSRDRLLSIPPEEWSEVLGVNLGGTFLITRCVGREMVSRGEGSIINVSSGAAISPRIAWGTYAISKAAVEAFSYNLAAELKGSGVRVNIVDPGAMRTTMRADAYPDEEPGTLKLPDAIAPLFLWLAGDQSRDVTGERFQADQWLKQQSSGIA